MTIIEYISALKYCYQENEKRVLKEFDLSPAEFKGISSIASAETINCKELSARMKLSISRGSRVINKLVDHGYLDEIQNKEDKRYTDLFLTAKGISVKKKITDCNMECEKKISSNLSPGEIKDIKRYMKKLLEIL
jgi:DNA-binding MarR family transcriptional regulator